MTTGTTTTDAYTTLHALAEECEAHALAWDQRHDPDGHAAAWDALHALLLAAGAWVEHLATVRPDLTPTAVDDIAASVRRLAAHLTVAEGDAMKPPTPTHTEVRRLRTAPARHHTEETSDE